jgi:hypothetical protein
VAAVVAHETSIHQTEPIEEDSGTLKGVADQFVEALDRYRFDEGLDSPRFR